SVRRLSDDVETHRLPGVGPPYSYLAVWFSPDGRFLHQMCHADQGVRARLWKVDGPRPIAVLEDDHISFAFRPDSRQLAAGYADGSIRLYDTESGQEVRGFRTRVAKVECMWWNPKLPQIALCTRGAWRLLDVDTGQVHPAVPVPGGVSWADWHPEGRLLAVSSQGAKIYLWDTRSQRLVLPPLEGHKNGGVLL